MASFPSSFFLNLSPENSGYHVSPSHLSSFFLRLSSFLLLQQKNHEMRVESASPLFFLFLHSPFFLSPSPAKSVRRLLPSPCSFSGMHLLNNEVVWKLLKIKVVLLLKPGFVFLPYNEIKGWDGSFARSGLRSSLRRNFS